MWKGTVKLLCEKNSEIVLAHTSSRTVTDNPIVTTDCDFYLICVYIHYYDGNDQSSFSSNPGSVVGYFKFN